MTRRLLLLLCLSVTTGRGYAAGLRVGEPFRDFTGFNIASRRVERVSSHQANGPLMVYFFAYPVVGKLMHLRTFQQWLTSYEAYGFRIVVVGHDTIDDVAMTDARREADARFPFLWDRDRVSQKLCGITSYPTFLLFDKNGTLRLREDGMTATLLVRWEARLTRLLRELHGARGPELRSSQVPGQLLLPVPASVGADLEGRCRLELAQGFLEAADALAGARLPNRNLLLRAQVELREANQLDPQNLTILRSLAQSHEKLGALREAVQLYKEVLRLNPRDPVAKEALERLSP